MSDILIKGMEMPEKCCECFIAKLSPTGETLICNYMLSSVPWDEKPFDCPLVPVPPHGRLIDADAVYKRLQKQAMSVWGDGNPRYQIFLDVMDAIRFAPTIIPAEEGE